MSALLGLVTLTFDRLTLKLVSESHLRWRTFGLLVLELFAMYATDGQADGRTKATLIASFPTGRGGITSYSPMHDENRLQQRFINVPSLSTFGRCH